MYKHCLFYSHWTIHWCRNLTNEIIDTSWVTNSDHDHGVLGRTMTSVAVEHFRFLSSGFIVNAALWR